MALQPWRKGIVIKIEDHTHNTRRYWIQVPEMDRFDFAPGQFVTLDLPIHEKINKRLRSYSIASWPDGSNVFELLIVKAKDGVGTAYLFDEVKTGTELTFRGAQGVFTLPAEIDSDLFLICTGTGLAPFRSMVNYIYLHNLPVKNIYLIFGCRHQEDLLYYDELKSLEANFPAFHYHPVLSRAEWEGHKGYVHPVYEALCANKQPARFYICGWKNMVDEAKQRIIALGYEKKDIHLELYG
jgi:CDP-4-dehydro-6-deoxyglucose reductase